MKYPWFLISLLLLTNACSKGEGGTEPPKSANPTVVSLEFPIRNSECTTGIDQGNDKVSVEFRWKTDNNDSYELVLENLATNQTQRTTTTNNNVSVILFKNTPYEWYVVSKVSDSNKKEESERWKFYSAGDGVSNYAPFPANLVSPIEDSQFENGIQQIKLEWEGSDIDDDNLKYDIYVGSENPPTELIVSDITEQNYTLPTNNGDTLFWRIVTKDESENTSSSKTRKFSVAGGSGILSFEVQQDDTSYNATIDEDLKIIKIRLGNFDYKKLAPQIDLKEGYGISPESGTEMNFHDSLFYVVTDSQGRETKYNLQVESGQHEVEAFKVHIGDETYIAQIDTQAGEIHIEMGNFDYTTVTPEIQVSLKATIEMSEITAMDLNNPLGAMFTVTSETGTSKVFTVKAPISLSQVRSYYGNPGFEFTEPMENTNYKVFAGSTQYFSAQNIQDPSQVIMELVDEGGNKYNLPFSRHFYYHQHSFETSSSHNSLTAVIPDDLPSGNYSVIISESDGSTAYPHRFEVINDNRVIRITEINKTDFTLGDTLVLKGVNLRKAFSVKSNGSIHIFNQFANELSLNEDATEMQLIFTINTYNRLKSWTGNNEKPLAIQTPIDDYPHLLNSNIVYFNVN